MAWMPERPAVSAAQLSALPWPREVTTPIPVTATRGRPCAVAQLAPSRSLPTPRSSARALAAPVADGGHDAPPPPRRRAIERRRERDAGRRLRLHGVAEEVAGRPRRRAGREVGERLPLLGRDPGDARRAGDDQRLGDRRRASRPQPPQRGRDTRPARAGCGRRRPPRPSAMRPARRAPRRARAASSTRKAAPLPRMKPPPRPRARRPARNGSFQRKPPIS